MAGNRVYQMDLGGFIAASKEDAQPYGVLDKNEVAVEIGLRGDCALCKVRDGKRVAGSFRCMECSDLLCNNCAQIHESTTTTFGHHVIKLSDFIKEEGQGRELLHEPRSLVKCEHCSTAEATMYCADCHQPICTDCEQEHHSGHRVSELGHVVRQMQCNMTDLLQSSTNQISGYERLGRSLNNKKRLVEFKRKELGLQIERRSNELKALIDNTRKKFEDELHQIADAEVYGIDQQLNHIDERTKQARSILNDALINTRFTRNLHDIEFSRLQILAQLRSPQLIITANPLYLSFYYDAYESMQLERNFGEFGRFRVYPVLDFTASQEGDKMQPYPTGIYVNEKLHIYVVDNKNAQLKIFDFRGHPLGQLVTSKLREPFDVTGLKDGRIVVTDYGMRKLLFFSEDSEQPTDFPADEFIRGISADDVTIYVTAPQKKAIYMYNYEGGKMRTINEHDGEGLQILQRPTYIAQDFMSHLIVTDCISYRIPPRYSDRLYIIDQQTSGVITTYPPPTSQRFNQATLPDLTSLSKLIEKERGRNYDAPRLMDMQGITADDVGHILVADKQNNQITMIDSNGYFVTQLVTAKEHQLFEPQALDCASGYLFVTQSDGRIRVYRYL